jgi:hypothetical protein
VDRKFLFDKADGTRAFDAGDANSPKESIAAYLAEKTPISVLGNDKKIIDYVFGGSLAGSDHVVTIIVERIKFSENLSTVYETFTWTDQIIGVRNFRSRKELDDYISYWLRVNGTDIIRDSNGNEIGRKNNTLPAYFQTNQLKRY